MVYPISLDDEWEATPTLPMADETPIPITMRSTKSVQHQKMASKESGQADWNQAATISDSGTGERAAADNCRNIAIKLIDLGFWRTNGASWCKGLLTTARP
jgi:hypothetical protein